MQTHLADFIRDTATGREADAILRSCVHCGFCTATCPTYQLLGDELDGPRGRIYLIKQMLEGGEAGARTRLHLDRCLTCRSCETTCPSGVRYSRLLDIGRAVMAERMPRSGVDAVQRLVLREALTQRTLFAAMLRIGRGLRPLLPAALRAKLPVAAAPSRLRPSLPSAAPRRRMVALGGCVQGELAPAINIAATQVLAQLGIALDEARPTGCCGALRFHLDDVGGARADARRNIDAWWPLLDGGAEAVVMTASGCAVQVRDYGHLLQDDERYAAKAERVAVAMRDISEVLLAERAALTRLLAALPPPAVSETIAFHAPCTLQHGLKIRGVVEDLLRAAGYRLAPVADSHLCCGSAGTYSLLQAELATRLRDNKVAALTANQPSRIATANIGCLTHLAAGSEVPVQHWIELIAERLSPDR